MMWLVGKNWFDISQMSACESNVHEGQCLAPYRWPNGLRQAEKLLVLSRPCLRSTLSFGHTPGPDHAPTPSATHRICTVLQRLVSPVHPRRTPMAKARTPVDATFEFGGEYRRESRFVKLASVRQPSGNTHLAWPGCPLQRTLAKREPPTGWEGKMRFMMLMIPKGYECAEPNFTPDPKAMEAMLKYNESMRKASVMLGCEGLHPPSAGARITFRGGKPSVTDGPFPRSAGGARRLLADTSQFTARGARMGDALSSVRHRNH